MTEHTAKLESKIKELEEVCKSLGNNSESVELFTIIHRPGWTTVAEVAFAASVIDSLIAQGRNMLGLRSALLAGARQVEAGKTVGV
jgi:hypothetical protein